MYKYNDNNDALTIELINKVSKNSYWDDSEKRILELCKAELRGKSIKNFIDLGCGLGRLIPIFLPFTENLFAVEPDRERFELADKIWSEQNSDLTGKHVSILNGDIHTVISSYNGLLFDGAISSHVLQHIPYALVKDMYETLAGVLNPNAVLFVTTTISNEDHNIYTKESFDTNGARQTETTDKAEFERVFTENGTLPVAYYTPKNIAELFDKIGFDLIKTVGFHYCFDDRFATIDDDIEKQSKNDLTNARDVLYIFRKR